MKETLETRTMRRAWARIVPFIILLYFVSFLNRVNVGFAALTMNTDIGLSASTFGFGAGIFFAGYIISGIPSTLILERVGSRRWIAFCMIVWGLASAATAYVSGPISFFVMRFILGVAEAGFFPGVILFISYWFPANRRAAVMAAFMAAAPLSSIIGSPISGGLMEMDGLLGIKGWQWLFLLEALPTVLLGVMTFFYMSERPEKARWLADDERQWLVDTMAAEQVEKKERSKASVWSAFNDLRVLAIALIYFGTSCGLYAVGFFGPLIFKQFGFSLFNLGLVNAIPNIVAVVGMVLWARHSDRTGERIWHITLACVAGAVGMFIAGYTQGVVVMVVALSLASAGISAAKAPMWSLPTQFLSGSAAAAGIALVNTIGNLGGSVGPFVIGWLKDLTGGYGAGLVFIGAALSGSSFLAIVVGRSLTPRRSATPIMTSGN
jgi:ACS family tartrate transporter-like MFS transporter